MTTHRTGSYDYNVICDVCGFKFKASELRKRWDGFMVCAADWEPRNILDFYKTKSDAHLLPFTRPDDTGDLTWTPVVSGITSSGYSITASYIVDVNNVVSYKLEFTPTTGSITTNNATISLPVGSVSVDKKGVALTSLGRRIGQVTANTTIHIPNGTVTVSPIEVLLISGQYTKA